MLAIFTGLLGTLFGLILGNRLALGRDRRREFNDVACPIHENLAKQLITINAGNFPTSANELTSMSFVGLKSHLAQPKVKKLDVAIKNYEEAKANCGSYFEGIYSFHTPKILVGAIEELQKYVVRK